MSKTNFDKESFVEECTAYVLDLLNPEARKKFKHRLNNADDYQREIYQKVQAAAEEIAFDRNDTASRKAAEQDILSRLGEEPEVTTPGVETSGAIAEQDSEENGPVEWSKFSIAAAIALLFITLSLVFYAFSLSSGLGEQEQLNQQQQTEISELQNTIQEQEELLSILASRGMNLITLQGLGANPGGFGKVLWSPDTRNALLQVSNIPATPENKQYQLWIIKNNRTLSAGRFSINDPEKPGHFFKVEIPEGVHSPDSFTLTLEPEGGSAQPTGDLYLLGNRRDS